jgi:hypothetical protein
MRHHQFDNATLRNHLLACIEIVRTKIASAKPQVSTACTATITAEAMHGVIYSTMKAGSASSEFAKVKLNINSELRIEICVGVCVPSEMRNITMS